MPELPEVETWVRRLREGGPHVPSILGLRLEYVKVHLPRLVVHPDAVTFTRRLAGQRIHAVGRRGKFILVYLDHGVLLLHLGMSGSFRFLRTGEPLPRHAHLVFLLENGYQWVFRDPRTFGRAGWYAHPWIPLASLGPEPLNPEFSWQDLYRRLRTRRARIKSLLLDQRFLAGVGNIYADEALYRAGLHPLTPAYTLTPAQARQLWQALQRVLCLGIRYRGATFDAVYPDGEFQNHFLVYGREKRPCYTCGTAIERRVIAGRSAYFCPRCQPYRE